VDPEFRRLLTLGTRAPILLDPLLRAIAFGTRRFPAYTLRRMNKHLPDVDHVVIEELIDADAWTEYASECFRHGTRGARFDFRLVAGPWGFRPEDVDVPVHLWHGEQDVIHPPALARKLAALLPNCDAHFFPDGGAYVGFAHADELADTLVAASRPL
jgi:pimeloyl-ACP methyl ester carboxylesterase